MIVEDDLWVAIGHLSGLAWLWTVHLARLGCAVALALVMAVLAVRCALVAALPDGPPRRRGPLAAAATVSALVALVGGWMAAQRDDVFLLTMGQVSLSSRDCGSAIRWFERMDPATSTRADVLQGLSDAQYLCDRKDDALVTLDRLKTVAPSLKVWMLSARIQEERGRLDAAERDLQAALRLPLGPGFRVGVQLELARLKKRRAPPPP